MDLIDVESFTAEPDSDVFYSGDSEVAKVRHYPGRDINRRPRFLGCQSKTFVDLSGGSRYPEYSFFGTAMLNRRDSAEQSQQLG